MFQWHSNDIQLTLEKTSQPSAFPHGQGQAVGMLRSSHSQPSSVPKLSLTGLRSSLQVRWSDAEKWKEKKRKEHVNRGNSWKFNENHICIIYIYICIIYIYICIIYIYICLIYIYINDLILADTQICRAERWDPVRSPDFVQGSALMGLPPPEEPGVGLGNHRSVMSQHVPTTLSHRFCHLCWCNSFISRSYLICWRFSGRLFG
jgi:hypothetical protein